jgi:hypothetical protein
VRVPDEYRQLSDAPFLVQAKKVIVSRSGMIALPCGPFGLFASCEAFKCGLKLFFLLYYFSAASPLLFGNCLAGIPPVREALPHVAACQSQSIQSDSCPYPKHERVFVMTQYDDTQIGQFVLEDLPKLFQHLDFLRQNPDVKIHFGFNK